MIPSPLHLDSYFFTKIALDICPEACDAPGEGRLEANCDCQNHESESAKWMVNLKIRQVPDDERGCPAYTFDMQVVGFFEVAAAYPAGKAEQMVRANGPAVLYGVVREMVTTLTARGPFPMVTLPSVTFVDEAQAVTTRKPTGKRKASAAKKTTTRSPRKRKV